MINFRLLALAGTMALSLAGCGDNRIAMPADLAASTEALPISGMGIGRRGDFDFAGGRGTFTRGADRISAFSDFLVRYSGAGTFRFTGADGVIEGACRYRAEDVNQGIFSVRARPFTYQCRLGHNGRDAGELVIEEEQGTRAAALGRDGRHGFIVYRGTRLDIHSIHQMATPTLPTPQPLGYRFLSDGRAVGAVDLNGAKTVYAPPSGQAREAVYAGSLALSVLWDPASL